MINSVGKPRVIINGTCLDFLAESFMAGDPLNGGGFAILNGIEFDDEGKIISRREPYPGSNLFSQKTSSRYMLIASIYISTLQVISGESPKSIPEGKS